ncbi:hypothetical protein [Cytobacillus sp. IB215665]|uniref:hypothetical protein n=1 Tax=Cytobacillus sp. IB215665 TaxID=3097357 RepID=UPI002A10861A|nr:hypothetical protein [Cytobacillus sp. IB215665]MDX8366714.1 hypothetical protein [Cytobacillus sp. IB215665]
MKIKKIILSAVLGVALVAAGTTSSAYAGDPNHHLEDTNGGSGAGMCFAGCDGHILNPNLGN